MGDAAQLPLNLQLPTDSSPTYTKTPQQQLDPAQSAANSIEAITAHSIGLFLGGGGVNYSAPLGDGQFDSRLKVNQLMMQWQDSLNQLKFQAGHGKASINYQHNF